MMFIRMKALYYGQKVVLGGVAFLGLFSFAMNAYLLTRGVAVLHNPESGVRGKSPKFINISEFITFIRKRAQWFSKMACMFHWSTEIEHHLTFSSNVLASSSAWLPLLYDTVILGLTLYRTFPSLRNKTASYVMRRLFHDGLVYYRWVSHHANTLLLS